LHDEARQAGGGVKGGGQECPLHTSGLGCEAAPVGYFFQAFSAGVFEEADTVAGMFEFVDISPNLGLPGALVGGGFSATGATSMKSYAWLGSSLEILQFEEDAAYFFNFFVRSENVFVAEKVSETELAGFEFSLFAGVERPIFGSQLLGRVASHPENVLVSHIHLSPGL
jgi:hypothetical protein